MKEVAEQEVGEETMKQVEVFREIPRTRRSINSRYRSAVVLFRVSENTWLEAIVRYLVHPKECGHEESKGR